MGQRSRRRLSTLPRVGALLRALSDVESSQPSGRFAICDLTNGAPVEVADVRGVRHDFRGSESAQEVSTALRTSLVDLVMPSGTIFSEFRDADGVWAAWSALLYDLGTYESEMTDVDQSLRFAWIRRDGAVARVALTKEGRVREFPIALVRAETNDWPYYLATAYLSPGGQAPPWYEFATASPWGEWIRER